LVRQNPRLPEKSISVKSENSKSAAQLQVFTLMMMRWQGVK
jgi:hypothetical protein